MHINSWFRVKSGTTVLMSYGLMVRLQTLRSPRLWGCMEYCGTIVSGFENVQNAFWLQIFECRPILPLTVQVPVGNSAESQNLIETVLFNSEYRDVESLFYPFQAKLSHEHFKLTNVIQYKLPPTPA